MAEIKNVPKINEQHVDEMRKAFEHRATWMYLLMDEARRRGLDWDDFARKAIYRCGCFHGNNMKSKMNNPSDMIEFSNTFGAGAAFKIFEMEKVIANDEKYYLNFNYCPLVSAWQKQGCSPEEIAELCDIAMEGDRGIASAFKDFQFTLGKTIAQGHPVCEIRFNKKK
ncbi:MAG: L-2-amino-thiazoline-4-carboxylic acid hydrolase, partial [Clostridiales bacterium]|nr:L-2-amino-thiazoline-4-carboxylic acid hydrolase [Clostridiales bacterium]